MYERFEPKRLQAFDKRSGFGSSPRLVASISGFAMRRRYSLHPKKKTDWLNRGTVRAHGDLPPDHPGTEIRLARTLLGLFRVSPNRFTHRLNRPFGRVGNDALITDRQLTLVAKRESSSSRINPHLYCLRPIQSGGVAALFMVTGDVDLVGMFGRWKGESHMGIFGGPA